jgi:lactate dehydrogenase-like 2-hydroxyacid dehydrogenase
MVEYGAEFGRLDKELIDLLPKSLKVIAAGGAGFDWADTEELGRRGPLLQTSDTNCQGSGIPMALVP